MNRSRCLWGLLVAAAELSAVNSLAQPSTVQFEAPDVCPDAKAFQLAVETRGGSANVIAAGDIQSNSSALFVRIEQDATGFEGRVSIQKNTDGGKARTARAARCEEVVEAMALVTVLTLEDDSKPPPDPVAKPVVQSRTAAVVNPPATPNQPVPPSIFEGSTPLRFHVHDATRVEPGTVHVDGLPTLTLAGGALFGMLPGVVLPRISATWSTTQFLTLPDGSQNVVGAIPLLRLSYLGPGQLRRGGNSVELDGLLGGAGAGLTLGVCTTPHYNSRGWAFLTCAELGGKILSLRLEEGDEVTLERNAPFLDLALSVSARYHISSLIHATIAAEGGAQVGESEVLAASGARIVSVGSAVGAVSLGLGVLF